MDKVYKLFDVVKNVGRAKYCVFFHDGVKVHPDGSKFFDVRIFTNKKNLKLFTDDLTKKGYKNE